MEVTDRTLDAGSVAASEILRMLQTGPPRTRAEIADLLGLARPTASLRIDPLIRAGLVGPLDDSVATGGRRASLLTIAKDARVALSFDIGTGHARVAVTDLASEVLASKVVTMNVRHDPVAVLSWCIEASEDLLAELGRDESDLLCIGVGVPCPIDQATGRPASPPYMPAWDGFDIPAWIGRHFVQPVVVDNDVNLMAIGERARSWPDIDHAIYVKVGTGIGAGIISGGQVQRGVQGIAGDIGHVRIARAAGMRCHCGNTGCLAAVASGDSLVRSLRVAGITVDTPSDIVERARTGDLDCIAAIRQAGYDIGEVLAAATSFINPSVIVIGGGLAGAGELLLAGIRTTVYAVAMPLATERLAIVESKTREHAGVIGASLSAIGHVFSPTGIAALLSSGAEQPAKVAG